MVVDCDKLRRRRMVDCEKKRKRRRWLDL